MTLKLVHDEDAIDRAALERCMVLIRDESDGRAEQIDDKLKDEPWEEVAIFAAYVLQCNALHLRPWESPPCHADENATDAREKDARALLRHMLAAGVSRFDPDPVAALAAANKQS